jgi:hypothetical protein
MGCTTDINVPDDTPEADFPRIAREVYKKTDVTEFSEDYEYCERGDCYCERVEEYQEKRGENMKPKPCPLCGSEDLTIHPNDNGIECDDCCLWFCGSGRALAGWREIRKDPDLPIEPGWLVEVWNTR